MTILRQQEEEVVKKKKKKMNKNGNATMHGAEVTVTLNNKH